MPKYNPKSEKADVQAGPNDQPPAVVEPLIKPYIAIPFSIMLVWDDPKDHDVVPAGTAVEPKKDAPK